MPEYICYAELIETSKMYMKGICSIENIWIPIYLEKQCTFSKPEETPEPKYDSLEDRIVCHRASRFGRNMWHIKPIEVEYPECYERFKLFGKFLLEGLVCEYFKKYAHVLLASPSTILKSWAK